MFTFFNQKKRKLFILNYMLRHLSNDQLVAIAHQSDAGIIATILKILPVERSNFLVNHLSNKKLREVMLQIKLSGVPSIELLDKTLQVLRLARVSKSKSSPNSWSFGNKKVS